MVANNDLTKGEKYALKVDSDKFHIVVYRGRRDDGYAKLWPHEFIGRSWMSNPDDSILSYRLGENSYLVKTLKNLDVVIPIPDSDGRVFFSNHYVPELDGEFIGSISREKRLELLTELSEAGL